MTRVSKDYADYGPGQKAARCKICKHFKPKSMCAIVIGKISPLGWCRFFAKETSAAAG